ncbi:MAG: hypothetical protein KDB07_12950, partial [Planctomycetes bacterium]|nr:hypothetical protein [Planctomycetota bacterium]
MSKYVLIGGGALLLVGLTVLVLSGAFTVGAQPQNNDIKVTSPVQGGSEVTFGWEGQDYTKIELSTDGGRTWRNVGASGSGDFKVALPKVNTNAAQVRLTLGSGTLVPSNLFSIDSSPPRTEVTGDPFIENQRIRIPFTVVGPDAETITLDLKRQNADHLPPITMTLGEAKAQGFPVPSDGTFEIRLTATDRVGNAETKTAPDKTDFIVDVTSPQITLDLALPHASNFGKYAMGGENISLTYTIFDAHVDLSSLRFEVIADDKVEAQIDPGADPSRDGNFMWQAPYEDWGTVQIEMVVSDLSGNVTRERSTPFAIFASTPEVNIVQEQSGDTSDSVVFTLAYQHIEGLRSRTVDLPISVHIYEADWDSSQQRFVWNLASPIQDGILQGPNKDKIQLNLQRQDRAYAARLVVGSGERNLSEPVPTESTQPESIWINLDRVRRM